MMEKKRLYEEAKVRGTEIKGKDLPTYPLQFDHRHRLGAEEQGEECLNVLFLGLTGSGKSMLLEVMGNYGLGVDFLDPYRFQVKKDGPTTRITTYTFFTRDKQRFPRPVTFIDTPGFQRGTLNEDRKLMGNIRAHILLNHPQGIHAIVYVLTSSQGRLTAEQRVAMQYMVSVLGEEAEGVHKISYLFCTFADSQRLPVLGTVRDAGLRYKESFAVNSSSFLAKKDDHEDKEDDGSSIDSDGGNENEAKSDSINERLFKMTTEGIEKFFEKIQGNPPIQARESHPPPKHEVDGNGEEDTGSTRSSGEDSDVPLIPLGPNTEDQGGWCTWNCTERFRNCRRGRNRLPLFTCVPCLFLIAIGGLYVCIFAGIPK